MAAILWDYVLKEFPGKLFKGWMQRRQRLRKNSAWESVSMMQKNQIVRIMLKEFWRQVDIMWDNFMS